MNFPQSDGIDCESGVHGADVAIVVAGTSSADFNADATAKNVHAEALPSSVVGLLIEPRTGDVFVANKCGVAVLVDPK